MQSLPIDPPQPDQASYPQSALRIPVVPASGFMEADRATLNAILKAVTK